MVQRISITSVMTTILALSFLLVSWTLFDQLSQQPVAVSTPAQVSATSSNPYASVPTLTTPVNWNNHTYYIQNSSTSASIQAGKVLGTGSILGKKAPIAAVAGVDSSKEVLVAWGSYYYLAEAK